MDKNTAKKAFRIKRRNSLLDVWITHSNLDANELILQESEVAEARWVTKQELNEMINKGLFHNYGKDYFNCVLEAIEEDRGVTV